MALSPIRRAFAILLVAAAVVAMLLMLAQDQETLKVRSDFEQDLRVSSRLELATWQQRSALEKSREKFWSYFGETF